MLPRHLRLRSKYGFTLLELAISIVILGVLVIIIAGTAHQRIKVAKAGAVVKSMAAIADASDAHRKDQGSWPTTLTDIASYLPANFQATNMFGNGYTLSSNNMIFTVQTDIPSGILTASRLGSQFRIISNPPNVTLSLTKTLEMGEVGEAVYDKQHLYEE
ncbi:prepilin-type N-terminal cleavage/methylation domain-containing protein [bacterium]|nr:prepilin-type N-terminal cleavage/methylation domain-containing protein [bacterium]